MYIFIYEKIITFVISEKTLLRESFRRWRLKILGIFQETEAGLVRTGDARQWLSRFGVKRDRETRQRIWCRVAFWGVKEESERDFIFIFAKGV